jgi:antirestriction protein ArdC
VRYPQLYLIGYISPFWLTYRQAQELGGHVKKGEHGSPVVYASTFKKKEQTEAGNEVEQEIRFLKEYSVFCADQCEGLPAHFYQPAEPPREKMERIEHAERFFAATQADIRNGGNRAYYACEADYVQMPSFETFRDAESHAATLAHELTHNAACRIMPRRS